MLELTLACALCAAMPDLSLVREPSRLESLLQAGPGGPDAPAPLPGNESQTRGAVLDIMAGVALLGYGLGYSGHLDGGRMAADWGGGLVASLPMAALLATVLPRTEEDDLGTGGELRGKAALMILLAGVPSAAIGGIAAAESLAGHPVQWRAASDGGTLGVLAGYAATFLVLTVASCLWPEAVNVKWTGPWGSAFLAGATLGLMSSAWASAGYSIAWSPSR